jgi:tetratricopeptide (TPR) repeat protein
MTSRSALLIVVFGGLAFVPRVDAQNDRPQSVRLDAAGQAVERVKARYFAMDYIGGATEATRLLKEFPASRRLAAWRVANLARIQRPKDAEAAIAALLAGNKNDPWSYFARALVQEYSSAGTEAEILQTSLEAYRRAPLDPDIIWLRALSLANNGQAAHALALIDSTARRGPLSQPMITLRATAMFAKANVGPKLDQAIADSAMALYAGARASDTTDVTANTFAASRLLNVGRIDEAYALAKRGVALSPLSLPAHETYWRAVDGLKGRTQAARDSEVVADVERLLNRQGTEPTVLLSAAQQYGAHRMPDRAREMETRVLAADPTSMPAEIVLMNRYRALRAALHDTTSRDTASYRRALWAVVDRPTHQNDRILGDAYRSLFEVTDSTRPGGSSSTRASWIPIARMRCCTLRS